MKLVHFHACNGIPLEKYVKQCMLQRELGTPNAPVLKEYGAYANAKSAREFLMAVKNHTRKLLYDQPHSCMHHFCFIEKGNES